MNFYLSCFCTIGMQRLGKFVDDIGQLGIKQVDDMELDSRIIVCSCLRGFFQGGCLRVCYGIQDRMESQSCWVPRFTRPNPDNLVLISSQSFLRSGIEMQSSLLAIVYTSACLYILQPAITNNTKMSLTQPQPQIHNLLQQTIIRIPYFLSPSKSTPTLSIQIQNSQTQKHIQQQILNPISLQQFHIIGYQWKLYYDREGVAWKSLIVLFDGVGNAERFYFGVAGNVEKGYGGDRGDRGEGIGGRKYAMYFCRDITETGVNMSNILYTGNKISIQAPESAFLRQTIKQVSKLIIVQGIRAQIQVQKHKTQILPDNLCSILDFMDPKYMSSQANYYRWRVYSYLQGDGQHNYQTQKFKISQNGPIYVPPQIDGHSDKQYNNILSHSQRGYVTKLLDSINCNKYHIEEAMTFFIMYINAAVECSAILAVAVVEACGRLRTQEEGKDFRTRDWKHLVALFYLISDILFNSPTTIYRDIFTTLLPSLISRIPQIPQIISRLQQLLQLFDKKFIFEQQFLRGLKLSLRHELPSMKPLGMQQMTRSEHQSYKQLIKLQTVEQIQQLCWKYGIVFQENMIEECVRNLAAVVSYDRKMVEEDCQPEAGEYDGEVLTEKDLLVIRKKECKVVSLEDINVRQLFQKDKNSKSINLQKQ